MNFKLQNLFSFYKGCGNKTMNSSSKCLFAILQEPIPITPVILDFRSLNNESSDSSLIEMDSCKHYVVSKSLFFCLIF